MGDETRQCRLRGFWSARIAAFLDNLDTRPRGHASGWMRTCWLVARAEKHGTSDVQHANGSRKSDLVPGFEALSH